MGSFEDKGAHVNGLGAKEQIKENTVTREHESQKSFWEEEKAGRSGPVWRGHASILLEGARVQ